MSSSIRVRERERKKSQQGQRELWEKRWFRSFSAHPAERRCDSMPLPPNRPVGSSASGRLQFQARWPLCAEPARRLHHLFTMCIYIRRFFLFSFLPRTSDWYIHSAFFARLWIMEMDKCDLFLTPPRIPPPAVPILSFIFTYLFILYRMKASGQESSADSLLYSCVSVCVFAIQNITMKQSLFFYRNSLVFTRRNKPEHLLHFNFHDLECAFT